MAGEMSSKEYSWAWLTADRVLSHNSCELVAARLVASAASGGTTLYDGENANGVPITELVTSAAGSDSFEPPVPIYCDRGLYASVGTNAIGVLVQWRELPRG